MLLTNSTSSKLSTATLPLPAIKSETNEVKSELSDPSATTNTTTFTLMDSNGDIIGNAAASKQMLLANGIRIAAPSATIGQQQQLQQQQQHPQHHVVGLSTKAINIPLTNKNIPIITGYPYQLPTTLQSGHCGGGGTTILASRHHKTFTPLTPPPMSSRKFVEPTQSRIRSFSLSSHKFSANHQLHVQNQNNNNSMMVDDIPPTQQHPGYATATSSSSLSTTSLSQHSPPRHGSSNGGGSISSSLGSSVLGIHFMASMQTGVAGSNHVSHVTPRRRTISSTSNG